MQAKSTTLVLLGRTGNGKSSTGNSILGRNAFPSIWSSWSVTKECKLESRTWKDGRIINVIDTPGLFDTSLPKEDIDRKIVECINLAKGGVHGFLMVMSLKNRFTDEEADVINGLEMLFGPAIVNYMVLVFTAGDKLEKKGMTLEKELANCPPSLKGIIRRCNSRMLLFNNKTPSENQITKLLEQVDCIVADNGNKPYSNDLFNKAQIATSELYHVRDKEKVYKEQIKRLNEMMEQNSRAMEEKMQQERRNLEKQLEDARAAAKIEETFKQGTQARIKDLESQMKIKDLENQLKIKDLENKLASKPPERKRGSCAVM